MSKSEHLISSPCAMNDLPQTNMKPLLCKTACQRCAHGRMSTEYLHHLRDDTGVTTTCRDRLTGREITILSKYLIGADDGNSLVVEHGGPPFVHYGRRNPPASAFN